MVNAYKVTVHMQLINKEFIYMLMLSVLHVSKRL